MSLFLAMLSPQIYKCYLFIFTVLFASQALAQKNSNYKGFYSTLPINFVNIELLNDENSYVLPFDFTNITDSLIKVFNNIGHLMVNTSKLYS